jgi:AraC-like DNA-binding protein
MSDFSTAAVIRLIKLSLKRQGIDLPHGIGSRGAHISLQDKRALLSALYEKHGPHCLLRIGEAIRDAPDEPVLIAMRLAHDPHDLLARWQHLEQYAHSRHRTICIQSMPRQLVLRHISHKDGEPPLLVENLLIASVLAGFFELIGATGFSVQIGGHGGLSKTSGRWTGDHGISDTANWEFSWKSEANHTAVRFPDDSSKDWSTMVRAKLEVDPGRRWTVDTLAKTLGMSSRTLQRRFRKNESSFSQTLGSVRLARSAELLARTNNGLAEIGYICGFSDQAHFTREFKRQTAFTPVTYRKNFT